MFSWLTCNLSIKWYFIIGSEDNNLDVINWYLWLSSWLDQKILSPYIYIYIYFLLYCKFTSTDTFFGMVTNVTHHLPQLQLITVITI